MENKYYTPSIEEFFVGFECEWQSKIRQESWNKQICDVDLINIAYDSFEHSDIEEPFNEQFRVKYLDSSDIEELGFNYKDKKLISTNYSFLKELNKNEVCKIDVYWQMQKIERENLVRIYKGNKYEFPYTEIFRGNIKNKSEFKKVLNMLNIK